MKIRLLAISAAMALVYGFSVSPVLAAAPKPLLLKATSSPRINQLILNTLRTWKFFPALEQGKPVPSVQDIRIHIDVS
jgi:hypothetical protein